MISDIFLMNLINEGLCNLILFLLTFLSLIFEIENLLFKGYIIYNFVII
jgi:hypothetical protein